MPRLRNAVTGTVVDVSEETALLLDSGYQPVEDEKKAPAKKAASSSKSEK